MLLPIRSFFVYRPGQLALFTILALIPVGIAIAAVATEPSAGFVAAFFLAGTIGAAAMLGGFALWLVPAARHLAQGLIAYGASLGVIVFTALSVALLFASVASCAPPFA